MRGRKCVEIVGSSRGMYIRNTADIPELYEIARISEEKIKGCVPLCESENKGGR
ncbi:MAG TPA: hypothetical protein VMW67_07955 [Desulfobacteria bacterium]|nr:hypothetical protein [Desulfobacteria bacterium]